MKKILTRIFPNFLKKIDAYLLLNAPFIWSSKLHKLGFLSVCAILILVTFIKMIPIAYDKVYISLRFIKSISIIIGIILLIYWLLIQRLLDFSINFGKMKKGYSLKVSLLFLIASLLIYSVIIAPVSLYNKRLQEKFLVSTLDIKDYHYMPTRQIRSAELLDKYTLDHKKKIILKGISDRIFLGMSIDTLIVGSNSNFVISGRKSLDTSDLYRYKVTFLNLEKSDIKSIPFGKYGKNIKIHQNQILLKHIYLDYEKEILCKTYEIDGEFFPKRLILNRLISEIIINEVIGDSIQYNSLSGYEKMQLVLKDGKFSVEDIKNEIVINNKIHKINFNQIYQVHSNLGSSMESLDDNYYFSYSFVDHIIIFFITCLLFFLTSLIKYFNLKICLSGASLFTLSCIFFLLMEASIVEFTHIIILLFLIILGIVYFISKSKVIKIYILQFIVYTLFIVPLVWLYINYSREFYSTVESNDFFHVLLIDTKNLIGANWLMFYAILTLIYFLILIPFLLSSIHKVYALPSKRS